MIEIPIAGLVAGGIGLLFVGALGWWVLSRVIVPRCQHKWIQKAAPCEMTGRWEGSDGVVVLYECSKCPEQKGQVHFGENVRSISPVLAEEFIKKVE